MNDPNANIACPNCGATRPAHITRCSNCGAFADSGERACPKCGAGNPARALQCANCGLSLRQKGSKSVVWIALFVALGVPAGCLGGCFMLFASTSMSSPQAQPGAMALAAVGLVGIAIFGVLLWFLIRSGKK